MKKLSLPPRTTALLTTFAMGCLFSVNANAAVVTLNFEGIIPNYPNVESTLVGNFYNGGTSGSGTSGTNYGVTFSDNALAVCLNTPGNDCSNASRGGLGDPNSQQGSLFFLTGAETYLNYAAGFDTGFAFNYSAINQPGTIGVYSGLNGTGTLLASLTLPVTQSACGPQFSAAFCPFVPLGVSFIGTAMSIAFGGVANQIAFDDVTFGATAPPNAVPLPGALPLFASVLGIGGWLGLRKKRAQSQTIAA